MTRSDADLRLVKKSIFIGLIQPFIGLIQPYQVSVTDDLTVGALTDAG